FLNASAASFCAAAASFTAFSLRCCNSRQRALLSSTLCFSLALVSSALAFSFAFVSSPLAFHLALASSTLALKSRDHRPNASKKSSGLRGSSWAWGGGGGSCGCGAGATDPGATCGCGTCAKPGCAHNQTAAQTASAPQN